MYVMERVCECQCVMHRRYFVSSVYSNATSRREYEKVYNKSPRRDLFSFLLSDGELFIGRRILLLLLLLLLLAARVEK